MVNKKQISLLIICLLATSIVLLGASSVRADQPVSLNYNFYGWDMVSNSWTKGDLAGWNEGDLVRYQLVINGDPGDAIPTVDIVYNFYDTSHKLPEGGVLVDYLTDFMWGNNDFNADGPNPPAGFAAFTPDNFTAPTTMPDNGASPANERYFEIRPGTDGIPDTIPSSGSLVIYYRAHLARSIVWLNLLENQFPIINSQISWALTCTTPHYGASFFPGSSPHFTVEVAHVGKKAIPIPVPPPPEGIISGHKWNDVNMNGNHDNGDLPLSGWQISC